MAEKKFRLAVGYRNSSDVEMLREALINTDIALISYDQNAQRVFDNAVRLAADAVLLSPDCEGYRSQLIHDLLFFRERPIPTIGWTDSRRDDGRNMVSNGAKGYVTLPMDAIQVNRLILMVHEVVDGARRERDDGQVSVGAGYLALPGQGGTAWQSKVISVYVPKGGGSHRTTTAVNLSTVLSHVTIGNQKTMLLDFDQTKGDCHTMLGYILMVENLIAARRDMATIERGLYDLIVNVAPRYGVSRGQMITLPFIKNYIVNSPAIPDSQLDLLPGLLRPTDSGMDEFLNRDMILDIARTIIQQVRRSYAFTVVDIGQDFSMPLHEAAIKESDEVLVIVPPIMTAVIDTRYALQSLEHYFGDLNKFKLLITGYDPGFGLAEREIVDMVGLPLAATIPFDPVIATTSVNTHTPYVLTDNGPLGTTMRALGGMYLPQLNSVYKPTKKRSFSLNLRRIFMKD
jgi:Flp pilus assembly CpaE family ATPase